MSDTHLANQCYLKFVKISKNPIEYESDPRSVVIADLNNDSFLDFVVANHLMNNIIIYLGNIDGHFSQSFYYSTGPFSTPYMIHLGDLNNDNLVGIAVAYFGNNNISGFLALWEMDLLLHQ